MENAEREILKNYDRDSEYWNAFYLKETNNQCPSLFAKSIMGRLKDGKELLELGCGNGRDTLFFVNNGLNVYAIDASFQAICSLKAHGIKNANFICGDFVRLLQEYQNKFDYCYSRFSIHAISKEQEVQLLGNVYRALKVEGLFFIEVRSVNDEIYGKGVELAKDSYFYEGHFRRFIRKDELELELKKKGFEIEYCAESRGFAPFKGMDPNIIRIIARKR